jgi:hypothetical protein
VAAWGLLAGAFLGGASARVEAQAVDRQVMASDEPAGYIVFPKIVTEDSRDVPGELGTDTLIQITNTARAGTDPVLVHCWYINANSHCDGCNAQTGVCGPVCETHQDCQQPPPDGVPGTLCIPGWRITDFSFELTNEHPIGWLASTGRSLGVANDETLATGTILGVPESPFIGELKCLQVDTNSGPPSARNDLKGEATIITVQAPPIGGTPPRLTSSSYNAIGFQVDTEATGSDDAEDPLCLGSLPANAGTNVGCAQTYAPCPNVLILNHFFDFAPNPVGGTDVDVRTELTLVPCSERLIDFPDFRTGAPPAIAAQMLIYNEFEQRFSTDARVQCYRNTQLSDIDTFPGPADDAFSLFSVGVQGTLAGQTRIRGVTGTVAGTGFGLIGVAEEFYFGPEDRADATAAFNLHAAAGFRAEGDAVYNVNEPPIQ